MDVLRPSDLLQQRVQASPELFHPAPELRQFEIVVSRDGNQPEEKAPHEPRPDHADQRGVAERRDGVVRAEGRVKKDHEGAHHADENVKREPVADRLLALQPTPVLPQREKEIREHHHGGDDADAVPPSAPRLEGLVQR